MEPVEDKEASKVNHITQSFARIFANETKCRNLLTQAGGLSGSVESYKKAISEIEGIDVVGVLATAWIGCEEHSHRRAENSLSRSYSIYITGLVLKIFAIFLVIHTEFPYDIAL